MRNQMNRRTFLQQSGIALATWQHASSWAEPGADTAPRFSTANAQWQKAYDGALQLLAANV
jgi:hypothetical protein